MELWGVHSLGNASAQERSNDIQYKPSIVPQLAFYLESLIKILPNVFATRLKSVVNEIVLWFSSRAQTLHSFRWRCVPRFSNDYSQKCSSKAVHDRAQRSMYRKASPSRSEAFSRDLGHTSLGAITYESENEVESRKVSFLWPETRGFCENYDFSAIIGS